MYFIIICTYFIASLPLCQTDNWGTCSPEMCDESYTSCKKTIINNNCNCSRLITNIQVVCPKWRSQPFTFAGWPRYFGTKRMILLNGLNNGTSLILAKRLLPNVIGSFSDFEWIEISNFCTIPSSTVIQLDLIDLFTAFPNKGVTPSNLHTLKLRNNCIQSITGKMDNAFQNLRTLDLSGNKLIQIPQLSSSLSKMTNYDISNNFISMISKSDFSTFLSLEQLNISNNKLIELSHDLLFNMKFLEVLDVSHNSISALDSTLLKANLLLQKFYFTNNLLTQLPKSIFENCRALTEINLSHNKLKNFNINIKFLKKLEILQINSNKIEFISGLRELEEMKNLKTIDVSNNSIQLVRELAVHPNSYINFNLSSNRMNEIPFIFVNLVHRAEMLDLSNNCIRSPIRAYRVPINSLINNFRCNNCCLTNLQQLTFYLVKNSVNLAYNNITNLDVLSLRVFKGINKINLSFNNISRVNLTNFRTSFKLKTKLISFDISHNPLVCDCKLNAFIKYLKNQKENFKFNIENNYCSDGTSLKNISKNLLCAYSKNCPNPCKCYFEDATNISHVLIECSYLNLTYFPQIPNYHSRITIHLNLSNNQITQLPEKSDNFWSKITVLDLSNNRLKSLKYLRVSQKLTILFLNNNSLEEYEDSIASLSSSNAKVKLAHNPWKCNCEMKNIVLKSSPFIDKNNIECVKDGALYNFINIDQFCVDLNLLFLLIPFVAVVILISTVIVLVNKYKSEITYYMFSKGICLKFVCEEDIDADKEFDAFVSYSHEDEDWIADFLIPGLETGPPEYKLCLHNRDWLAGEFITDQIVKSVESSRRTIIILTDNFLKSEWSRMEFEVAYQQAIKDGVRRLIIVIPDQVPDLSQISKEFKTFITLTTYIQANKPYFWTKLRATMPRIKNIRKKNLNC